MMSIKTDNIRLNKGLITEKHSESKTVFSKKLSSLSTTIALLHLEKEQLSPEKLSKIKQKLADFYHLDCKEFIELKDDLKESLKIKTDKSINTLEDEKEEEIDYSNIEGLLLTQRKIYSQICDFEKENKIEKKVFFRYEKNKTNKANESVIENDLNKKINFESNKLKAIDIFKDEKEVSTHFNDLTTNMHKDKIIQKLEKRKNTDKIQENIYSKPYLDKLKTNNIKNKIELKHEKDLINIKNSVVFEKSKSSKEIDHLDSKNINKNTLLINVENKNSNIESLYKEKAKENVSDVIPFNSIKPEYQQMLPEPLSDRKILDIPAFSLLYKRVSALSQPPSITYIFKKWGNELHQMKVNFDTDKKIQLIASTGRVYQSSLESFSQYQGRLSLSLENDNNHWHINAIDPSSDNKEDEK
ncbi:hypothetical protein I5F12_11215 [Proteus cibarius]|uniref:hypothetical protein n=1 Tax=Proteus terrae TaxID=1574161 RepID=UPI0018C62342|nr:hypothetical protein [Proteus terrae]MBG6038638.1 hypothetical protein [Proteus terrae subsp. cibarius]